MVWASLELIVCAETSVHWLERYELILKLARKYGLIDANSRDRHTRKSKRIRDY